MSYCMDCGAPEGKAHGSNCATHERATRSLDTAWDEGEQRMAAIGPNGNDGEHYPKQARYQDRQGEDWIDEFARIATPDEFRAAMRFTIGKYLRRIGKKDRREVELRKVEDYARRWREFEQSLEVLD
ncbi:hypothetical protein QHH_58 [Halomonas phage QHHSV-1]|nr:hypothetical protein QHH_58 [Halomonas phage QHHSV-1]